MITEKTLFTQVQPYYKNLVSELTTAQDSISMMYYAFDHGEWAEKIGEILIAKAQARVHTRLMVDDFGQVLDEPRHIFKNQEMMNAMVTAGVEIIKV